MKYKILLKYTKNKTDYYKFYQDNETGTDWESLDKDETEQIVKSLLNDYNLNDLKIVIGIDVGVNITIPALPNLENESENKESV